MIGLGKVGSFRAQPHTVWRDVPNRAASCASLTKILFWSGCIYASFMVLTNATHYSQIEPSRTR